MADWGPLYLAAATLPILTGVVVLFARHRLALARALSTGGMALTAALAVAGAILYTLQNPLGSQVRAPLPWTGSITWLRLSQFGIEGYGRLGFSPDAPAVELHLGYHVDALAWLLFVVVGVIALLTLVWAGRDLSVRCSALVCFLTGVVLHALIADNLLQLYFCWALASLATAWFVPATLRVFLLQRVGDVGLLLGIVILVVATGTDSLVTVTEVERDVTGKIVTEDGQPKTRIARLSVADALRVPEKDSHDNPFDEPGATAGQWCRVNPARTARGKKKLELADQGALVVVWNQETRNGHYDRPERRRFDAFDPVAASGHGKGLHTVPYWVLCLAGFAIVLGCLTLAGQAPLPTWFGDAAREPTGLAALVLAIMPLLGLYGAARAFPVLAQPVAWTMTYCGVITAVLAAERAFFTRRRVSAAVGFLSLYLVGLGFAALGIGGWNVALIHACLAAVYIAALVSGSTVRASRPVEWLLLLLILLVPIFQIVPTHPGVLTVLWSYVALDAQQIPLLVLSLAGLALIIPVLWSLSRSGRGPVPENRRAAVGVPLWPVAVLLGLSFVLIWAEPVLRQSELAEVETGSLQAMGEQMANGYFNGGSWLRGLHEATGFGPQALALASAFVVVLLMGLAGWILRKQEQVQPGSRADGAFSSGILELIYQHGVVAPVRRVAAGLDRLDRRFWPGIVTATTALVLVLASAARIMDDRMVGGTVRRIGWLLRFGRTLTSRQAATSTTPSL